MSGSGTLGQILLLSKVRFRNTFPPGVFRFFDFSFNFFAFSLVHPFAVDRLKSSAID